MTQPKTPPMTPLICAAILLAALAPPAQSAGDPTKGALAFDAECADCHSVKPGKNKKGPSLAGVVGRPAGTIADMNYSDAMRGSKLTWTPDRIDAYIADPKAVVPGGKMKYEGLPDAQERADLLAYLQKQH